MSRLLPTSCVRSLLAVTIACAGCDASVGSESRNGKKTPVPMALEERTEQVEPAKVASEDTPKPSDAASASVAKLTQARDWKRAAERCGALIAVKPSAETYLARGICHDRMGQDKEALDDFAAAEKLQSASAAIHVARAAFYQRREQPEPGIVEAQKALQLEANNADAQLLLALLQLQRQIQAALDAQKSGEILALMATNITWRVDMPGLAMPGGYEQVRRGTEAAEREIQQIIERNPTLAEAHAQLGRIRFDRAVVEGARAEWARLMDQPDVATHEAEFQRQLARAVENLTTALKLDPQHASAVAWQAAAQHAGGEMGDPAFIEQLKSAIHVDPFDPAAIQLLVSSLRTTQVCDEPLLAEEIQDLVMKSGQPAAEFIARDAMRTLGLVSLYQVLAEAAANAGLSDKARDATAKHERFRTALPFYEQLLARLGKSGFVPPQLRD